MHTAHVKSILCVFCTTYLPALPARIQPPQPEKEEIASQKKKNEKYVSFLV